MPSASLVIGIWSLVISFAACVTLAGDFVIADTEGGVNLLPGGGVHHQLLQELLERHPAPGDGPLDEARDGAVRLGPAKIVGHFPEPRQGNFARAQRPIHRAVGADAAVFIAVLAGSGGFFVCRADAYAALLEHVADAASALL